MVFDLLEQSSLGVVAEVELLAEVSYDLSGVIAFVDLDLLNVSAVQLDLEDADWLLVGLLLVWIAALLLVGVAEGFVQQLRELVIV